MNRSAAEKPLPTLFLAILVAFSILPLGVFLVFTVGTLLIIGGGSLVATLLFLGFIIGNASELTHFSHSFEIIEGMEADLVMGENSYVVIGCIVNCGILCSLYHGVDSCGLRGLSVRDHSYSFSKLASRTQGTLECSSYCLWFEANQSLSSIRAHRSSKKKLSLWYSEKDSEESRDRMARVRGTTKFDSIIMYNIPIMGTQRSNKGSSRRTRLKYSVCDTIEF